MHILDKTVFKKTLQKSGFRSIEELAKKIGVHRNTIHYFLSGHRVIPVSVEKIMKTLNIKIQDILIDQKDDSVDDLEQIAELIDKLHAEFPFVTFVLFGSRARGDAKKYSDWDIGIFASDDIDHDTYRKIVMRRDELIDDLPFFVDIVNLCRADSYFLREASRRWQLLSGKLSAWMELQRKAAA